MPRVSVVIPVFNPGSALRRSLDSVLTQTYSDLECIVVDDGSTEDVTWVADVADSRITMVRQANRGVSVARNVGVAAGSGRYVAFIDQDDEWLPDKLQKQMDAVAAHPDAAFWCTRFTWVSEAGSTDSDAASPTYAGLLADQHVCLSSALVDRQTYLEMGGHDPLLSQMQDFDLFLRMAMMAPPPVQVQDLLVRYHLHGENASRRYDVAARERFSVLARHETRARRLGRSELLDAIGRGRVRTRELYSMQTLDQGRAARREGDIRGAAHHLRASAILRPTTLVAALTHFVDKRIRDRRLRLTRRS